MNYRILFIGVPRIEEFSIGELKLAKDEELYYNPDLLDAPTLYDYDIIFLCEKGLSRTFELLHKDINKYSEYKIKSALEKTKSEFQRFLSMPGALVVFPIGTIPEDVFPARLPEVEEKEGEVIKLNRKHPLSAALRNFKFNWLWHLKNNYPERLVIAKNNPGLAVSYEIKLNSGARVFFLPNLENSKADLPKFLRVVLNMIKSNYMPQRDLVEEPKWVGQYLLPGEKDLRKKVTEMEKQLGEFKSLRQVVYSYGDQLSYSVYLLLRKTGIKGKWKEREGQHDIELDLDGTLGIVEVKGLKGTANNDDLRQLLDHYMKGIKSGKEAKGVFVLNHFREVEPEKRGDPFTKDAIRIADGNNFCLMTTIDLFDLLGKFLNRGIDTAEITKLILGTRGKITT
ncbi:MAG: hypothetical protein WED04_08025 [Promethearchaeati archaeon SRVP18_Atabeyarchaeia-1]